MGGKDIFKILVMLKNILMVNIFKIQIQMKNLPMTKLSAINANVPVIMRHSVLLKQTYMVKDYIDKKYIYN